MKPSALLLSFLLLGAASPARQAHPALWKVADADTTIFLFGTIHVLPAGLKWRDPALDAALARSDSLMLETVLDEQPRRLANILATMGRADGLPPLDQRVPPAKRAALLALVKGSGYPLAAFTPMKTWAAAVVLTGTAFRQIDLGADAVGVEPQLEDGFRRAKKPVEGLETPEQQLGYFDRLPEASQRAFLVSTLDSPAEQKKDFVETVGRGAGAISPRWPRASPTIRSSRPRCATSSSASATAPGRRPSCGACKSPAPCSWRWVPATSSARIRYRPCWRRAGSRPSACASCRPARVRVRARASAGSSLEAGGFSETSSELET